MALNVPGLIVMLVFYALVLLTGIWAARKSKREERKTTGDKTEITLLGGRSINLLVGIFTMTATWVGGGFILGISEAVYNPKMGLIWALMPLQYSLSFVLGGLVFAKPMRERRYVTMIDPFQEKYGRVLSTLILIPAIIGDILWVACTLISLGSTVSVILDLQYFYSIVISAAVAIVYTLLGGLFSVAYTDVIQLLLIFVSLWLCVPFLLLSPIPSDITVTSFNHTHQPPWVGVLEVEDVWRWLDDFLVLGLGCLSFQCFHQRTLSASSVAKAQVTCFAAGVVILILGVPPILVGAVAASTDWNLTGYGLPSPYERGDTSAILPITLQYLTPNFISIVGIGAIAAAVMSSTDSALISSTSMFSSNIYKKIIRQGASDREMLWVIRITVVVVGLAGTGLTFLDKSVLAFWVLGADMSYTVIFPQLVAVLFFPISNGYGAVAGYVLGALIRILSGEPLLGMPPLIHFPGSGLVDGVYVQRFPVRTVAMLFSLCSIPVFSFLFIKFFGWGLLPKSWDVFEVNRKAATSSRTIERTLTTSPKSEGSPQPVTDGEEVEMSPRDTNESLDGEKQRTSPNVASVSSEPQVEGELDEQHLVSQQLIGTRL
ncbi:high-affinity choline transporter 1 [Chanos chanos]|uniref:High-affinity choline transporter 1-like n=1 Tax=Chanos chanos TaxID=29144 RepID=A0A6J2WE57_CHACN|nr:high-affinity choline transporter 1-like [Chanos chanos]XP_030643766.1 high-affinity choline transporter 1-like [Chanos chanos]